MKKPHLTQRMSKLDEAKSSREGIILDPELGLSTL
jgi:hypothetical protein